MSDNCPLCQKWIDALDDAMHRLELVGQKLVKANQNIDALRDGRRANNKARRQLRHARNKLGKQVHDLGELLAQATPPPADEWTAPEFDDAAWVRSTAAGHCRTPQLARLCLRAAFTVTVPASVKGLALTVGYHGGAVVYLNGKEIARRHVAPGAAAAAAYPREVFVTKDGKPISLRGLEHMVRPDKITPDLQQLIAGRARTL